MHTPRIPTPRHIQRSRGATLAGLALCLAAPFAMAPAAAQMSPARGNAYSPGYIDISVGSSDYSKPSNGFGIFDNDQRATAYSVSMGNYVFSPNWGLEVGYTDFGSVKACTASVPNSRPRPESLLPPNGSRASLLTMALTNAAPTCSCGCSRASWCCSRPG